MPGPVSPNSLDGAAEASTAGQALAACSSTPATAAAAAAREGITATVAMRLQPTVAALRSDVGDLRSLVVRDAARFSAQCKVAMASVGVALRAAAQERVALEASFSQLEVALESVSCLSTAIAAIIRRSAAQ